MERFNRMPIAGKLLAVTGVAIGGLLAIAFAMVVLRTGNVAGELSTDSAVAQAEAQANALKADIGRIEGAAHALADGVASINETGVRDRTVMMNALKRASLISPIAVGSWFFAEPNFDGQDGASQGHPASNPHGNFVPYWLKTDGKVSVQPDSSENTYGEPYYALARDSGKPALTEPYVYNAGGRTITMTSIAVPVKAGGRFIGVGGMDIALDDISARLGKLKPFGTGRVTLLSGNATWLAHPDAALRMKPYDQPGLDRVKAAIASGETQVIEHFDANGEDVMRVVYPVAMPQLGATWALVLDVPTATIGAPATTLGWQLMLGGILVLGAALAALWYAIRAIIRRPLASLTEAVDKLSRGDEVTIPQLDREDEIGTLARAADVFRQAAEDRAAAERTAAEEQRVVTAAVSDGLEALTKGDLTAQITAAFPAGYVSIKTSFNAAVAQLKAMIGAVTVSATGIRTGSQEIAQASEDLARRTESNAASLEETSAALAQIDERLRASAVAASQTVRRADEAIATVTDGRSIAGEAVRAMERVSDSAKGIDQVIEGVDKIAFQTRVLAMNAAVEAGRAGDAGRGFAVVADLVSALAMRAEEEAKRARDQLTVTQGEIITAVEAVERVDGALADISSGVGEVHGLLGQMASDNQAQSSAVTQISAAVTTMDQSTQQNAAMVEQSSAAARNLTSEAISLSDQAARFRTEAESTRPVLRVAA